MMDLAGAQMLAELAGNLRACGMSLTVVKAHGRARDLLRAEGLDSTIEGIARAAALEDALA
jgi:hypothetical protein